MIRHERFQLMLAWPRELSMRERLQLDRHLATCADCRESATVVSENRDSLRGLVSLRPPPEVRTALLEAVDASHEAASLYGPVLLPFLIMPMTFIAVGLMLVYGWVGVAGVLLLLLFVALGTAMHAEHVGGSDSRPFSSQEGIPWREFGRSAVLDAFGVLIGGVVIVLLFLLLAVLSGLVH